MVLGELDSNMEENESRPLSPYTKINSKLVKDLNVRHKTIKTIEKKTGSSLFDLNYSNFILEPCPKARKIKAKINYCALIKIK